MQLGVLVSGNLGLIVLKQIIETYSVSFVLTDKQSTSIIDYCTNKNINYFAGNPRKENILEKLSFPDCDLIVSVNYLFIIDLFLYHTIIFVYPTKKTHIPKESIFCGLKRIEPIY